MEPNSLFRREVLEKANARIEGRLILVLPISIWVSSLLLLVTLAFFASFAMTAEFGRKIELRGWLEWSKGLVFVGVQTKSAVLGANVAEGDWVYEGQAVAWTDAGGIGGSVNNAETRSLISSPIAGQILASKAQKGAVIDPGETLFVIAPEGGKIQARLLAPSNSIGALKAGQEIEVSLDAFPSDKFGTLSARIISVSRVPFNERQLRAPASFKGTNYVVDAELDPTRLLAFSDQSLLKNGMELSATIVMDRRTLMDWILGPISEASEH